MRLRGASGEPAGRGLGQRIFGIAHDLAPRERLLRGLAFELGVPLHARGVDAARVERGTQPGDARDHANVRQPGEHVVVAASTKQDATRTREVWGAKSGRQSRETQKKAE